MSARPIVLILLPLLAASGCRKPDSDALPLRQSWWCCNSTTCYAAKIYSGFPPCADILYPGNGRFSLSQQGFEGRGQFRDCGEILLAARRSQPEMGSFDGRWDEAWQRMHDGRAVFPDTIDSREVAACLPNWDRGLVARPTAYVMTGFDERSEKSFFMASPTKYYCEKDRETGRDEDGTTRISTCDELRPVGE